MNVKICPKCGEEKPLRGAPWHIKNCKGTLLIEAAEKEQAELPAVVEKQEIVDTPVQLGFEQIVKDESLVANGSVSSIVSLPETQPDPNSRPKTFSEKLPGLESTFNLLGTLQKEVTNSQTMETVQVKPVGVNARCPRCKCAASVKMIREHDVFKSFHCGMCGNDFKINTNNGDYLPG